MEIMVYDNFKNRYEDILRLIEIDIQKELQEFMSNIHQVLDIIKICYHKNQGFKILGTYLELQIQKMKLLGGFNFHYKEYAVD